MEPTPPPANVLPFPIPPCKLAEREILISSPARESNPSILLPLYAAAVAPCALREDEHPEFAALFRGERTVRRVAMAQRFHNLHGFALAAPVATGQEFANALRVNRVPSHAKTAIERGEAWILVVSVDPKSEHKGVGRALANQAMVAMYVAGAKHVFVAVRSAESRFLVFLSQKGFVPGGTNTDDTRTILSRTTSFTF